MNRYMEFYLGVHMPSWLWDERFSSVPLFLSWNVLRKRRTPWPRPAPTRYAVDSGAFSMMKQHGRWTIGPEEYIEGLYRLRDQLGPFDFAAQQDKMCERFILDRVEQVTGRRPSVREHQEDSTENYVEMCRLAPDLHIMPTVQGGEDPDSYHEGVDIFRQAGVNLAALPRVGIGSICRRQASSEVAQVVSEMVDTGIRVHAFGAKLGFLDRMAELGAPAPSSFDSMAWSFWGRRCQKDRGTPRGSWMPSCAASPPPGPGHGQNCANCAPFALAWRDRVMTSIDTHYPNPERRTA